MNGTDGLIHNDSLRVGWSFPRSNGTILYRWQPSTSINLSANLAAVILNISVLSIFWHHQSVRTAFNYYIANLCTVNLYLCTILYACDIVDELHAFARPHPTFCVFRRYLTHTAGALLNNATLLIALNRLWSVSFPVSYRYHHISSILVPRLTCAAMWAYAHAWTVPAVLVDAAIPQLELVHCTPSVRGPRAWSISSQVLLYDVPIVVTLLIYPFLVFKVLTRARSRGRVEQQSALSNSQPPTTPVVISRGVASNSQSPAAPVNRVALNTSQNPSHQTNRGRMAAKRGRRSIMNNPNKVLTLTFLIMTAVISLLPAQVFYTLLKVFSINPPGMLTTTRLLYLLSPICDPLLFLLTIKEFRDVVSTHCRFCRLTTVLPSR